MSNLGEWELSSNQKEKLKIHLDIQDLLDYSINARVLFHLMWIHADSDIVER